MKGVYRMGEEYHIPINEMEKIPAAKHLSDQVYRILIKTNAKHLRYMWEEDRDKYSLNEIIKVEINREENCLNVYYSNSDWWHYTLDGNWY